MIKRIVFALLFICVSSNTEAATRTVGMGKDYATIQLALNAASCGDTIVVYAGTYADNVTTTQNCTAGNEITVIANTGDTVTVTGQINPNHNYHIFSGFVNSPTAGHGYSIAYTATNITIQNNTLCVAGSSARGILFNAHDNGCTANGTDCYYDAPSNCTVTGNTFGPCATAISTAMVIRGDGHTVSNNTFDYWNGDDHIYILSSNSTISGNTFKNHNHSASNTQHPDNIQVIASDAKERCFNNVIEKNYFHNSMGQTIYTEMVTNRVQHDNTIRNNIFAITGAATIQASGPTWKIYNNTFFLAKRNSANPIGIGATATGSEINNNLIIGSGCAAQGTPAERCNTYYSATSGMWGDDAGDVSHSYNYIAGGPSSYGTKTITETGVVNGGNPLFVNAPIDWAFTENGGDTYGGDSTHIEVYTGDASKFVVGQYFEYCPYATGCDGVAREITDVAGGIVTFTPAVSGYAAPDCGGNIGTNRCSAYAVLWGTQSSGYTMDFSLQAGSGAIDTASTLSGYTDDYAGTTRPIGAAWDIGAYEYTSGSTHTLTVTKSGSGAGTVTSDVAGIDCGSTCTYAYDGTVVTLTAMATSPSYFSGWSGEGCSGTSTCEVTMSAARGVTATFSRYGVGTIGAGGQITFGSGGSMTLQ